MKAMVASACAVLALAGAASARPMSLSLLGPGLQTFSNGGGGGFGGTLGSGSIGMEIVGGDLRITLTPGNAVNDYVAIFLDTRAGGQTDATMDDQADDGRRVLSQLTATLNDVYPDMPSNPDFGGVFWNGGGGNQVVGFELTAGNTPGHLNYAGNYVNHGIGAYVMTFSLAQLGNPSEINWFAAYCSGGGYNSNESMPASASINGIGNPGFGDGQFGGHPGLQEVVYTNWNQYRVPGPGAAALLGLGALAMGRRRRA